jgi:thioredoxin reductase (NADPH)
MKPWKQSIGQWEVLVIGGGPAGLSAAIYLGRAQRKVIVIDAGRSMAVWEPRMENYLGFPETISGEELLERGRAQALGFGASVQEDEITRISGALGGFVANGQEAIYRGNRLLLATGMFHIPPDVEGVQECLGHSMFFCKDCDGMRARGKRILAFGWTNEAVEFALGLLAYSPYVKLLTNGRDGAWSTRHEGWIEEYGIAVFREPVEEVEHDGCQLRAVRLADGTRVEGDALFAVRGDVFHNTFARELGARIGSNGEIELDEDLQTSVAGLYAAGCVTAANCQMIIAAGQGAVAAQAINRALFEESLARHTLRRAGAEVLESSVTSSERREEEAKLDGILE